MKVLKFSINERYYDQFKAVCDSEDITIKKKFNVLVAQDLEPRQILSYFPDDSHDDMKRLTLKVNEELYKGVMKRCGKFDIKPNQYLSYLVFKYLGEINS